MLKRSILGAFGVVIFTVSLWSAETAQVIAVIDFTHNDTSALEASTASDYFRTGLINAAGFSVINKSEIEAAAKEYNLNLADSSDQNTFIKFAEHLKADIIVTGSLTKLNEVYFLSANAVNVKTNRFICSKNTKCTQSTDLPSVSEKLANEVAIAIAENQKSTKRPIESSYKKYAVYLMGATPEAYLDAVNLSGTFDVYNITVKHDEVKQSVITSGVGVKIYPWEKCFFNIYYLRASVQSIENAKVNVFNNSVNETYISKLDFIQNQDIAASINYSIIDNKKFRFSLGAGYAVTKLELIFSNFLHQFDISGINNYSYISLFGHGVTLGMYKCIAEAEYKANNDFTFSFIVNSSFSDNSEIINNLYLSKNTNNSYLSAQFLNYQPKKNIVTLKLLISYYFNIVI